MSAELQFCAWLYPVAFILVWRRTEKIEYPYDIICAFVGGLIVCGVLFCTIHAFSLAWAHK